MEYKKVLLYKGMRMSFDCIEVSDGDFDFIIGNRFVCSFRHVKIKYISAEDFDICGKIHRTISFCLEEI